MDELLDGIFGLLDLRRLAPEAEHREVPGLEDLELVDHVHRAREDEDAGDDESLFGRAAEHYAANLARGVDTLVVIPFWDEIERFNGHARAALRRSGQLGELEITREALLVSDGERLYTLHRGAQMGYRVFAGKSDAEVLIGDDLALRRKTPEPSQMHFTLLASDFDDEWSIASSSPGGHSRWKLVPERAIVTLERGNDPHIDL